MLILDLADDFLDQILEGDDALGPEYSSSTTARCTRPRRISARTSIAGRGQGTNSGWRISETQSRGGACRWPDRGTHP
jgi:hypothetical protein